MSCHRNCGNWLNPHWTWIKISKFCSPHLRECPVNYRYLFLQKNLQLNMVCLHDGVFFFSSSISYWFLLSDTEIGFGFLFSSSFWWALHISFSCRFFAHNAIDNVSIKMTQISYILIWMSERANKITPKSFSFIHSFFLFRIVYFIYRDRFQLNEDGATFRMTNKAQQQSTTPPTTKISFVIWWTIHSDTVNAFMSEQIS